MEKINLNSVAIELTNICNFNCKMCIKHNDTHKEWLKNTPRQMDFKLFKSIVDQYKNLPNNKVGSVLIQFQGESLLRKDFFKFCDYLEKENIIFGFTTNSSKLTPDVTDKLLKYKYFQSIAFSIDGFTKETFEKIRIGSDYNIVKENIEYFLNSIKRQINVSMNVVVQDDNKHELMDIVKYWHKFKYINNIKLSNVTNLDVIPTVLHDIKFVRKPCRSLFHNIIILTNGKVVACCRDHSYKFELGNINEQTLDEIWNGEAYNKLRNLHLESKWDENELCKNCYSWGISETKPGDTLILDNGTIITETIGLFHKSWTKTKNINKMNIYKSNPINVIENIPVFINKTEYSDNYDLIANDHINAQKEGINNPFQFNEYEKFYYANYIQTIAKNINASTDNVLDIGVAMGGIYDYISVNNKYGCDISIDYLKNIKDKQIKVCVANAEDLPYQKEFFDFISCKDVLEHVLDLNAVIREIYRILKLNGKLLIQVPYKQDMQLYAEDKRIYKYVHVRNFDEWTLNILFTRIFKFKILEYEIIEKDNFQMINMLLQK